MNNMNSINEQLFKGWRYSNMSNIHKTLRKIVNFIDDYYKIAPIFYRKWLDKYGVNNLNFINNISFEEENKDIEDYLKYCLYLLEECANQYPKDSEVIGFQIADVMRMMAESKELNNV